MKMFVIATTAVGVLVLGLWHHDGLAAQQPAKPAAPKSAKPPAADELDRLLAPIALYPDQLLAQILLCAADPAKVSELSKWLADNKTLKGTELQDAATVDGFEPSFVALALFPQVVNQMAGQIDWTTSLGKAFAANKTAVFDSIQRLRAQAQKAGALKDTPQQDVETMTTSSGQQVIVIEPANPQVIYVPQYNPTVVYMPPATSTVVVQESSSTDAAVAGLIGFTAGIVLGAAIDNDYYYGPLRMARRRPHVQRRVGRLVRRARRRARRLDRPSRGSDRRTRRTVKRGPGAAHRAGRGPPGHTDRVPGAAHRAPADAAGEPAGVADAGGSAPGQPRRRLRPGVERHPQRTNAAAPAPMHSRATRAEGRSARQVHAGKAAGAARAAVGVAAAAGDGDGSETVTTTRKLGAAFACAALAVLASCSRQPPPYRAFATPEAAVQALSAAVANGNPDEVLAIFGPDGKELIDSSDPVTARRNREVFAVALAEGWRLVDDGSRRTLVIGNEGWPFPVPIVQEAGGWRFDTTAGKEEVLARRIGRNELAAIQSCRTYVAAQRLYAQHGHDGKRAGLYARTVRSDPGRQNGLYWSAAPGRTRSPLGELMAEAADEQRPHDADRRQPSPFHGYYFKILTAQGAAAPGGAKDYVVNGEMSGGFALVAWPAQYDATGIMTFVVNQDGVVREKDLGPGTDTAARSITLYEPDASWAAVE